MLDRMLANGGGYRIYRLAGDPEADGPDIASYVVLTPEAAGRLRSWFSAFASSARPILRAIDAKDTVDTDLVDERLQAGLDNRDADALAKLIEELEREQPANHLGAVALQIVDSSSRWIDPADYEQLLELIAAARSKLPADLRIVVEQAVLASTSDALGVTRKGILDSRRAAEHERALAATPTPSTREEVARWVRRGLDGDDVAVAVLRPLWSDVQALPYRLFQEVGRDQILERARGGEKDVGVLRAFPMLDACDWRDAPEARTSEARLAFAARGALAQKIVEYWAEADNAEAAWRHREEARIEHLHHGPPPETLASFPQDITKLVIDGSLDRATALYIERFGDRVSPERAKAIVEAALRGFEPF